MIKLPNQTHEIQVRQDGGCCNRAGRATEMGIAACRSQDEIVCPAQLLLPIPELQRSLPALSGLLIHFLSHLEPPLVVSAPRMDVHPEPTLLRTSDDLTSLEWKPTKVLSGLEHMMYKERLRKLHLLSLEKRRGGDFFSVFNFLMSSYESRHFWEADSESIRGNRHGLWQVPIRQRKTLYPVIMVQCGHRYQRCGISILRDSPNLSRQGPEQADPVLELTLLRLDCRPPGVPSHLIFSVIYSVKLFYFPAHSSPGYTVHYPHGCKSYSTSYSSLLHYMSVRAVRMPRKSSWARTHFLVETLLPLSLQKFPAMSLLITRYPKLICAL